MMKMAFYLNRYVQFFSAGLLFFRTYTTNLLRTLLIPPEFCIFDGFNIPVR